MLLWIKTLQVKSKYILIIVDIVVIKPLRHCPRPALPAELDLTPHYSEASIGTEGARSNLCVSSGP